jgi:hypothetical protein
MENFGKHLGDFGLARSRRTLDKQGLVERQREKDRGLDAFVGDIAGAALTFGNKFSSDVH